MNLDHLRAKNLTIPDLERLACTLREYLHWDAASLVEEEIKARHVRAVFEERRTWANYSCRMPIERMYASAG